MTAKSVDSIVEEIVDAAYKIHFGLGPGLLEPVYEAVLAADLARRGLSVARQKSVSFEFDEMFFKDVLKVGFLVEGRVLVEVKSSLGIANTDPARIQTCLRLANLPLGLLLNFGSAQLKDGIQVLANTFDCAGVAALQTKVA